MKKERLYFVDAIKLLSFVGIVIYHAYSQVFFDPYIAARYANTLYGWLNDADHHIVFSGLSILIISMFLFGRQSLNKRKIRNLYIIIIIGTLWLMFVEVDDPLQGLFWEWDIYEFLIVSILSLIWLQSRPKFLKVAGILGFFMTWIPFSNLADTPALPLVARSILFGVCDEYGRGGWAIFPWIGLVWLCFYLGTLAKPESLPPEYKKGLTKKEMIFWVPALVFGIIFWGGYHDVPLDSQFYCFVFHRPPQIFWGSLIWIFFILRLALIEPLNHRLGQFGFFQWVSQLKLCTHFGLSYLLHLIYLALASFLWADAMREPLWAFDIFVLSILPVTEISARICLAIAKRFRGQSDEIKIK